MAAPRNSAMEAPSLCPQDPRPQEYNTPWTSSHQRFMQFQYEEAAGPREAFCQLWELCSQWLRPQTRSVEHILAVLVLEKFLKILPADTETGRSMLSLETRERLFTLVENLPIDNGEPDNRINIRDMLLEELVPMGTLLTQSNMHVTPPELQLMEPAQELHEMPPAEPQEINIDDDDDDDEEEEQEGKCRLFLDIEFHLAKDYEDLEPPGEEPPEQLLADSKEPEENQNQEEMPGTSGEVQEPLSSGAHTQAPPFSSEQLGRCSAHRQQCNIRLEILTGKVSQEGPRDGPGPSRGSDPCEPGPSRGSEHYGPGPSRGSEHYGPGPSRGSEHYGPGPSRGSDPCEPGPSRGSDPCEPGPSRGSDPCEPGPSRGSDPCEPGPSRGSDPCEPGPSRGSEHYGPGPSRGSDPCEPGPSRGSDPCEPGPSRGSEHYGPGPSRGSDPCEPGPSRGSEHYGQQLVSQEEDTPVRAVSSISFTQAATVSEPEADSFDQERQQCRLCKREFMQTLGLTTQVRAQVVSRSHQCPFCGKTFRGQSHVIAHHVRHTKERPFTCHHCQKSYKHKSSLLRHLKFHTRESQHKASQGSQSPQHKASQ